MSNILELEHVSKKFDNDLVLDAEWVAWAKEGIIYETKT